jgi:hypothetical protein
LDRLDSNKSAVQYQISNVSVKENFITYKLRSTSHYDAIVNATTSFINSIRDTSVLNQLFLKNLRLLLDGKCRSVVCNREKYRFLKETFKNAQTIDIDLKNKIVYYDADFITTFEECYIDFNIKIQINCKCSTFNSDSKIITFDSYEYNFDEQKCGKCKTVSKRTILDTDIVPIRVLSSNRISSERSIKLHNIPDIFHTKDNAFVLKAFIHVQESPKNKKEYTTFLRNDRFRFSKIDGHSDIPILVERNETVTPALLFYIREQSNV